MLEWASARITGGGRYQFFVEPVQAKLYSMINLQMRNSKLLLTVGLVTGFAAGVFVWQRFVTARLATENLQLREAAKQAVALSEENARLANERIDPGELKRLRDGQAELLRLRGQMGQLRRGLQTAQAAAAKAATAQASSISPVNQETNELPVDTFTANVTAIVGWKQMVVTGGWKLSSGKRAFVLLQPQDMGGNAVQLESRVFDVPDDLLAGLGLDHLRASDQAVTDGGILSAEDALALVKKLQKLDGVDLLAAPRVTTLTGQQAQISVTESHSLPSGQTYTTGPTINVVPTIGADQQTVELVVGVQWNLGRAPVPP